MGIILHNEQLKFGKYKGHTLSQVCRIDSAYVNWLIENINENVFELFDINYWTDVFECYHNILPKDGLYMLAFRDDNHISYKLEHHTAGTDIQNMYPLDGKGRDWFHCLAYHYIPKYSESNNSWKYHIKGDNLYAVWAVRNNAKQIEYSWGGYELFDYEKEHIREFPYACNFVMDIDGIIQLYNEGSIVPDGETFLGEFYIGRYSEEHHGNHNSFHEYLINNNKKLII